MADPAFEQHLLITLQELELGLKKAVNQYTKNQRDGAITALQTMINFVEMIPRLESQGLSFPITQILSSLNDLNSGVVVPLLQPINGINNRRRDDSSIQIQRAFVINALNLLNKSGLRLEDAGKFLVPLIKKGKMVIRGKRDTPEWKVVVGWRDNQAKRNRGEVQSPTLETLSSLNKVFDGLTQTELKNRLSELLPKVLLKYSSGLD